MPELEFFQPDSEHSHAHMHTHSDGLHLPLIVLYLSASGMSFTLGKVDASRVGADL